MLQDVFKLSIDKQKFESTNKLWNELQLNSPWSIGFVSNLIESKAFKSKEEWQAFYYKSGEERKQKLANLSHQQQLILNDNQISLKQRALKNELSYNLKSINLNYGRTKSDLNKKGKLLFRAAKKTGLTITEAECNIAVKFRVIAQTWNGIKIREKNALLFLQKEFTQCTFKKTEGSFDYKYAVDYELYLADKLIAGLQIKPKSYITSKAEYVQKAKLANARKNNLYHKQFKVKVFDVIFEKGELLNLDLIDKLKLIMDNQENSNLNNTKSEQKFWTKRYEEASTGWDIGTVSTPLKSYIDQLTDKSISILIPGSGNAYEAEYLWNNGFKNINILDIAKQPLQNLKSRISDFPEQQLLNENFFHHKGRYDLILEQTFFCSFPPTKNNRTTYAKQMNELLKPSGKLVGLWFNIPLNANLQKRPFGGNKQEYLSYLSPYFTVKTFEVCYNSIKPRDGNELFGIFVKK